MDAPALYDDAQRRGQNEARRHTREQSAALCTQFATLYHDMPCVTISGSAAPIGSKLMGVLSRLHERVPSSMVHLKGRLRTELTHAVYAAVMWLLYIDLDECDRADFEDWASKRDAV